MASMNHVFCEAKRLLEAEDYRGSIRVIDELGKEGCSVELLSLLAFAYEGLGNFEEAVACLTSVIEIEQKEASYLYRRGRIQLCFLGNEFVSTGIADLNQCLSIDDDVVMAHYLLSLEFIQSHSQDLDLAFAHLTRLLDLAPESPSTLYCAGQYYSTCGEFEASLEFLERGSRISSDYSALIYTDIASVRKSMRTLKDWQLGVEAITVALELEPTSHRYCIRASLQLDLKDVCEARRDLEKAKNLSPDGIADEYILFIEQEIDRRLNNEYRRNSQDK